MPRLDLLEGFCRRGVVHDVYESPAGFEFGRVWNIFKCPEKSCGEKTRGNAFVWINWVKTLKHAESYRTNRGVVGNFICGAVWTGHDVSQDSFSK
jgi:hypothetical protein